MSAAPPVVEWGPRPGTVRLLDQTLLPAEVRVLDLTGADAVAEAIRTLRVRGAPAIGVAAALGLVAGMERWIEAGGHGLAEARNECARLADLLFATRPTGHDLGTALGRLRACAAGPFADAAGLVTGLRREADHIRDDDRRRCRAIGEAGQALLPPEGEVRVLTHCNAGALATAGIGTALAPLYVARERGRTVRVWADETRPVLQGARLTAWELARAGIEVTVIADSMAAALMARGAVQLVITGADRIAANGDVANKIGTYALALLAAHHGLPFYVAAPSSTIDPACPDGSAIPVEERAADELRDLGARGHLPGEVGVWNPAFDVTPARYVTALVTEGGVLRPPFAPRLAALVGR
ncbi:MAG: S-methyl-5-thioribose-1-phosphate isomerase [Gemmatimonadetes bacterium]|nr:S-methyl-5-thioribose-1-phosphate isomerase [Gemmatimonadota bacterium]